MIVKRSKQFSSDSPIFDKYCKELDEGHIEYLQDMAKKNKKFPLVAYLDETNKSVSPKHKSDIEFDDMARNQSDKDILRRSEKRGKKLGYIIGGSLGAILGGSIGLRKGITKSNKLSGTGALIGAGIGATGGGLLLGKKIGSDYKKYTKRALDKRQEESRKRFKNKSSV